MRLIDASELFDVMDFHVTSASVCATADEARGMTRMKEICLEDVKKAPTVDAVPVVHGRWLECEDGWDDTHYQCSECGMEWNLDAGTPEENDMHYCPNCGARMEEDE